MTTSPPSAAAAVRADTDRAIAQVLDTVRANIRAFGLRYPDDTTRDDRYPLRPAAPGFDEGENRGWTTSFWPGMQWIGWELTGDDVFRDAALAHAADFGRRVREERDLDTHDLGFLYTLSCVAPARLLGDEDARSSALAAAPSPRGCRSPHGHRGPTAGSRTSRRATATSPWSSLPLSRSA